ncbi:GNAT family N-acetyltransferase [Chloroflexi bacterium TSY]|nr:GNAT family N-acetyltransferase [Chloroflexi bacterium TSY]
MVGYINGSVHFNEKVAVLPEQERYFEIDNIYVKFDHRGYGIGHQLMEKLLAIAQQNGIERFIVDSVSTEMDSIINFYRNHGFKLWYIQLVK